MKFRYDVLHNFISPVTGRILANPDYVLVGNDLGIAIPTPDLIDLRLDLINLRADFTTASSAYYVIGFPNSQLPNAQVLSTMNNGYLVNTDGVVSTTSTTPITSLPDLTYNNLWMGNILNRPIEVATINLGNLPNLGVAVVEGLALPAGKIWRGTSLNRPEESNSLSIVEADVLAITARLLTGQFVMGDALVQATWPSAQFLVNFPDGIIKKTNGKVLSNAVPGVDYVDAIDPTPINTIPVWYANNSKYLASTNVSINPDNEVDGISKLNSTIEIDTKMLILYGSDRSYPSDAYTALRAPENMLPFTRNVWVLPSSISTTGQVLVDNGPDPINPSYRSLRFVTMNVNPSDATYVIRTANENLPNAQVLTQLGTGITKLVANGYFAIAQSGIDYVNLNQYEALQEEIAGLEEQIVAVEVEVATIQLELIGIQGQITAIELEIARIVEITIAGVLAAIVIIEVEIAALQGEINSINSNINTISSASYVIGSPNAQLPNAQVLNTLSNGYLFNIGGVVSTTNVTPGEPINLTGFVSGGPPVDSVITTIRTPGDLDMGGDRVKNLMQDPVEDFDAVSITFLWNLLNSEVDILWP